MDHALLSALLTVIAMTFFCSVAISVWCGVFDLVEHHDDFFEYDDVERDPPALVVRRDGASGGDAHVQAVAPELVVSVRMDESWDSDPITRAERMKHARR